MIAILEQSSHVFNNVRRENHDHVAPDGTQETKEPVAFSWIKTGRRFVHNNQLRIR